MNQDKTIFIKPALNGFIMEEFGEPQNVMVYQTMEHLVLAIREHFTYRKKDHAQSYDDGDVSTLDV